MRSSLYAIAALALAAITVSCNPAKAYEEEEKSLIASYIAGLLTLISEVSGGVAAIGCCLSASLAGSGKSCYLSASLAWAVQR